ncbi:hypothetical protein J4407_02945 [Candidatus Pacearchaeota archaeon]|nr:hypothetical protein [Candidatus Pacearchaeota archaeon]
MERKRGKQELEHAPESCERCSANQPNIFLVNDKEWAEVVKGIYPLEVSLCEKCYDFIREGKNIKKGKRKHLKIWDYGRQK